MILTFSIDDESSATVEAENSFPLKKFPFQNVRLAPGYYRYFTFSLPSLPSLSPVLPSEAAPRFFK